MGRSARILAALGFTGLCIIVGGNGAWATPFPSGFYNYSAQVGSTITAQTTATPNNLTGTCTGGSYTVNQAGSPDPTVSFSGGASNGTTCSIHSQITYDFEVEGPSIASVPVIIQGSGTNSANLGTSPISALDAEGVLVVSQVGVADLINTDWVCGYSGAQLIPNETTCSNYSFSFDESLVPNTLYSIAIVAEGAGNFGGVGSATIDPAIFFDPTFTLTNEFTIVLSDGFGNPVPAAVPEPSSMAILVSGLVCVYCLRRRWSGQWL